jgi:hypothetical protein
MSAFDREACKHVLDEVLDDRRFSHTYHDERNLPDGTSEFYKPEFAKAAKNAVQQREQGTLTWRDLMMVTAISATLVTDPEDLRDELVELASLVVEWIEAIDRREEGV